MKVSDGKIRMATPSDELPHNIHGLRKILKPLLDRKAKKSKLYRAYSLIADSEVTPGSLEIWSDLPDEIKNDPSLAPFKSRYEKQYGEYIQIFTYNLFPIPSSYMRIINHNYNLM